MNDAGVIAVNAYNRLERSYGVFLLTPQSNGNVPEPSSLLLTLGALAAMAGCTRRKQRVILIEPSVKTSVVLA